MIKAYLENLDTNVIAVDWNRLALQEYTLAAENTRDVGEHLGEFIEVLSNLGISLDDITLVGHRSVFIVFNKSIQVNYYKSKTIVWVRKVFIKTLEVST